jgi:hypothetical protein
MADARVNDTTYVSVEEINCYRDGFGEVGIVICYRSWSYSSVNVMIVPQYPPYGAV